MRNMAKSVVYQERMRADRGKADTMKPNPPREEP